jgi:hypothetical protein
MEGLDVATTALESPEAARAVESLMDLTASLPQPGSTITPVATAMTRARIVRWSHRS